MRTENTATYHHTTERRLNVFLEGLRRSGSVKHAAEAAGFQTNHLYELRKQDATLAARWSEALDGFAGEAHATLTDAAFGRGIFDKPDIRALIAINKAHNRDVFSEEGFVERPMTSYVLNVPTAQRLDSLPEADSIQEVVESAARMIEAKASD